MVRLEDAKPSLAMLGSFIVFIFLLWRPGGPHILAIIFWPPYFGIYLRPGPFEGAAQGAQGPRPGDM